MAPDIPGFFVLDKKGNPFFVIERSGRMEGEGYELVRLVLILD
jgi:hypothetical protein